MIERGDRCEWTSRCRNEPTIHYNCNGIDKWVCDEHLDDLHKQVERYLRSDEYIRPDYGIEAETWRKTRVRQPSVDSSEVRKVVDDIVGKILAGVNK